MYSTYSTYFYMYSMCIAHPTYIVRKIDKLLSVIFYLIWQSLT